MPDFVAVVVVMVMVAGCKDNEAKRGQPAGSLSAQGFADAMRLICDAPKVCCEDETDPSTKATRMAKWISARVTNAEVRQMFGNLASNDPAQRLEIVSHEVKRAGIEPAQCAILNAWSAGPSL